MGIFGGSTPKPTPLVLPKAPKKVRQPVDPSALAEARARAEAFARRQGKQKLRIPLAVTDDDEVSGIQIP